MSPETQRIRIAEACGRHTIRPNPLGRGLAGTRLPGEVCDTLNPLLGIPDYLRDLNAMHEAEKVLTPLQQRNYWVQLSRYTKGVGLYPGEATAAQRAEAFLRTLGLWDSAPPATDSPSNQKTT